MNRPQRLPLKKLKRHIKQLQQKYSLTIKWGTLHPHYDEVHHTLYLSRIRSFMNYIVCLHEIGHFFTPELQRAGTIFSSITKGFQSYNTPSPTQNTVDNLQILNDVATRLKKRISTSRWRWTLESNAWQYAFDHSLVWNNRCENLVRRSMETYWIHLRSNRKNISQQSVIDSFMNFNAKYVTPIFHRINKNKCL